MSPVHNHSLDTDRLTLSPLGHSDAQVLSILGNDFEITSVTRSIPYPFRESDAEAWIEMKHADPDGFSFGVFLKPNGTLIGQIGLLQIEWDNDVAELGFFIGRDYWGNGYVTEASRRLVQFGFETLGFNRICAHHVTHNAASGAVLRKIGMDLEGTFRQRVKKNGVYEDVLGYAITADTYRETML